MRDMLEARKRGDVAFREKDFKNAIDCYSQVQFFLFARDEKLTFNTDDQAILHMYLLMEMKVYCMNIEALTCPVKTIGCFVSL